MAKPIPRLEVIESFIEAARAPNFRTAAERCALSPSAFSRRIQTFQTYVGKALFERHAGGMRLTQAGRECLDSLEPHYTAVRRTALELGGDAGSRKVTLSLSHSLAVGWLFPRLARFHSMHPRVTVAIQTLRTAGAIRSGDADLGICGSDIDVSDLHVEHFLDVDVTPVASPEAAARIEGQVKYLRESDRFGITQHEDVWAWWSNEAGLNPLLCDTARFDVVHAAYEASASGFGVALGMSPTIGPHLASGRLVELGMPRIAATAFYRLVTRPNRLKNAAVAALWTWMMEEGRADRASNIAGQRPVASSFAAA